ncbi:MAG: YfiR family protein [Pseudomonadota bacterium]
MALLTLRSHRFEACPAATLLLSLLLVILLGWHAARAQTVDQSDTMERKVKAAYLYKFASYVTWPDTAFAAPSSPLVIGVIGADALAQELEQTLAGKTINSRAIIARKLRRGEPLNGVHMLFIGDLEKTQLAELLAATQGMPILTITQSSEALALGSMINLVTDDKVHFEVALAPVEQSSLKISARMLTAASRVLRKS